MRIIAVGRMKDDAQKTLCASYLKRIRPGAKIIEITSAKKKSPSEIKAHEGRAILKEVTSKDFIIALDSRGDMCDSRGFSRLVMKSRHHELVFIIGGAEGLCKEILDRANVVLSLGRLTWPHMLVRIMLVEQIYRGQSILSGHPYHRKG